MARSRRQSRICLYNFCGAFNKKSQLQTYEKKTLKQKQQQQQLKLYADNKENADSNNKINGDVDNKFLSKL